MPWDKWNLLFLSNVGFLFWGQENRYLNPFFSFLSLKVKPAKENITLIIFLDLYSLPLFPMFSQYTTKQESKASTTVQTTKHQGADVTFDQKNYS